MGVNASKLNSKNILFYKKNHFALYFRSYLEKCVWVTTVAPSRNGFIKNSI